MTILFIFYILFLEGYYSPLRKIMQTNLWQKTQKVSTANSESPQVSGDEYNANEQLSGITATIGKIIVLAIVAFLLILPFVFPQTQAKTSGQIAGGVSEYR